MNASSISVEQITQITRKGQVTVPAVIRKVLDLHEGDRIAFTLTHAQPPEVTLRPLRSVTAMTFGALASPTPMLLPAEEHAAFTEGVADELAAEEPSHHG